MTTLLNPAPELCIEASWEPPAATVYCSGEIDLSNVDLLCRALSSWVEAGVSELNVDLRGVTFIDSMTIEVLLEVHRRQRSGGRTLHIRATKSTRRLLRLLRIDRVLDLDAG